MSTWGGVSAWREWRICLDGVMCLPGGGGGGGAVCLPHGIMGRQIPLTDTSGEQTDACENNERLHFHRIR